MNSVRHHYVPQGYLRGFSNEEDPSFVWVYDKRTGRKPRKKSTRSVAWAQAYYAQEKEDGSADLDTLEKKLAETIDNDVPPILSKIRPISGSIVRIDSDAKAKIAFFLGLSLTRVPSFRDGINGFFDRIAQSSFDTVSRQNEEFRMFSEMHNIVATAKPWVSLEPMIKVAQQIANSALKKNWQFFVAPEKVSLMTSDNPVHFSGRATGLKQIGPAHPGAELIMNLRRDLALVCTPVQGQVNMMTFSLNPHDARKFNRGVVTAAKHRVFTDRLDKTVDSFVKKYSKYEQNIMA